MLSYITLKEFEEMLTSFGFFRVHQSHLINLQYVEAFAKKGSGNVQLKNGEQIPVSTRRKGGFLQALEAILSPGAERGAVAGPDPWLQEAIPFESKAAAIEFRDRLVGNLREGDDPLRL